MSVAKKEGVEPVGMRLHKDAVRQLKIVAAERGSNVSALTQEALVYWWKDQPESKTKGPLFPGGTPSSAPIAPQVAAPIAPKTEQATPIKAAPQEEVSAASPLAKPPKKGA